MNWNLKHIAFSILIVLSYEAKAIDSLKFKDIATITAFSIDSKGNYFISDQSNSLIKYNALGKEITRVNTKLLGSIQSIDCSNPFEIYVFYKDQNILMLYDNMLNSRGEIKLNKLGYSNISCLSRSFDNGIWLFDYEEFELKKLDKEGRVNVSSGNILSFVNSSFNPYQILEYDNKIYLADSSAGILVFDLFGTFIKTIPIKGSSSISIYNNTLVLLLKNEIRSYHLLSLEQFGHHLFRPASAIIYTNKGIFYYHQNIIFRYQPV